MARLIVKSPYIKCSNSQGAGGYMKYIATLERVEMIPDDHPPTRKQEQLIAKLVNDFPDTKDLLEYEDYTSRPTKANASAFITLALEENWPQVQSSEGYAKYIATRPRAERLGDHGLFGDEDRVDLDKACLNWNTTQEMCGHTSSRSIGRTLSAWAITTPRRGVLSCVHIAMTLPPP